MGIDIKVKQISVGASRSYSSLVFSCRINFVMTQTEPDADAAAKTVSIVRHSYVSHAVASHYSTCCHHNKIWFCCPTPCQSQLTPTGLGLPHRLMRSQAAKLIETFKKPRSILHCINNIDCPELFKRHLPTMKHTKSLQTKTNTESTQSNSLLGETDRPLGHRIARSIESTEHKHVATTTQNEHTNIYTRSRSIFHPCNQ